MSTPEELFKAIRDPKFNLMVEFLPDDEEEFNIIIDELRTTLDKEPEITETGDQLYRFITFEELSSELFCLGIVYGKLEVEHDIICPFTYTVQIVY